MKPSAKPWMLLSALLVIQALTWPAAGHAASVRQVDCRGGGVEWQALLAGPDVGGDRPAVLLLRGTEEPDAVFRGRAMALADLGFWVLAVEPFEGILKAARTCLSTIPGPQGDRLAVLGWNVDADRLPADPDGISAWLVFFGRDRSAEAFSRMRLEILQRLESEDHQVIVDDSGAFQVVLTQDRGEAVMYLGEQDADPSVERAERLLRRHLADAAPETRSDRSAGSPEAADRTPVLLYLLAGYGSGTLN